MRRQRKFLVLGLSAAALVAAASAASACSIPVFCYAMTRWLPEPYEVLVFHERPLASGQQAVVEWLQKAASADGACANVEARTVDTAGERPPEGGTTNRQDEGLLAVWKAEKPTQLPWMVVRLPRGMGDEAKVWSGPLSAENAKALVDSPARREVAKHLLSGACAVWVLLEWGDREADGAAAKLLREELKKLEQTLELPPQMDPMAPEEEQPKAGQELRVSFSLVRVSRKDPAERVFIAILLATEADLKGLSKPMAFPVMGRGRALPPLVGEGIAADNIAGCCEFVVGPCACQVKAMNPGTDILMTADWDSFQGGPSAKPVELPPLSLPTPIRPTEQSPAGAAAKLGAPKPATTTSAPAGAELPSMLLRNVLLGVAAGLVVLAGAWFFVLRKGVTLRS
jgi:hypothetical protein